jgi:hypothetical protein
MRSARAHREYVAVLRDLLQGKAVSFAGEQLVARGQLAIDAEPCPCCSPRSA